MDTSGSMLLHTMRPSRTRAKRPCCTMALTRLFVPYALPQAVQTATVARTLMRGRVGAGLGGMTDYIARDPRTGKPINVGGEGKVARVKARPRGRWARLEQDHILGLATGRRAPFSMMQDGVRVLFDRKDGVEALVLVKGRRAQEAHDALTEACMDDDPAIRIAALGAMPEVAEQRSGDLFDHLSVMLDDPVAEVRSAANQALEAMTPVFPSGVENILVNALRSRDPALARAAWQGLRAMGDTWPGVVCVHVDSLLLEDDEGLRRDASKALQKVVASAGHEAWDLVSWALADEDVEVRRNASACLPRLIGPAPRMAVILAEKTLYDDDARVRDKALQVLQRVDLDAGRAKGIIVAGTAHPRVEVRKACLEMLPRFMGEDDLRAFAMDRIQHETNEDLRGLLIGMVTDISIEGTEEQKNRFLAPAEPVPQLDLEIAAAHEHELGLLGTPVIVEERPSHGDVDEGQQR